MIAFASVITVGLVVVIGGGFVLMFAGLAVLTFANSRTACDKAEVAFAWGGMLVVVGSTILTVLLFLFSAPR